MTPIPTWLERYQANPHKHTATYGYMQEESKDLRTMLSVYESLLQDAHIPVQAIEDACKRLRNGLE